MNRLYIASSYLDAGSKSNSHWYWGTDKIQLVCVITKVKTVDLACLCTIVITFYTSVTNTQQRELYFYLYCTYVYDPQKCMNDTLAVDSPFQTLAVDFSSNL